MIDAAGFCPVSFSGLQTQPALLAVGIRVDGDMGLISFLL